MQKQQNDNGKFPYHIYFFVLSVFSVLVLVFNIREHNPILLSLINAATTCIAAKLLWARHNAATHANR